MFVKWKCPACNHENVLNIDLESKTGRVVPCAQIKCRKISAINFNISVDSTATLTGEREKIIGEA